MTDSAPCTEYARETNKNIPFYINPWYCSQDKCQKEIKATECSECTKTKPRKDFAYKTNGKNVHDRCRTCQHPTCEDCGVVSEAIVFPKSKVKGRWRCPKCNKK